ncbi:MAG: hypothetical protein HOQ00_03295 [Agromyces sp.]|nr:hypothetical protein [Agromyces sp.]
MSATLTRPASPATGIAAAAIRIGRALEAWGRAHALRRRAQHLEAVRLAAEATAARRDRDMLITSTTHAPLL